MLRFLFFFRHDNTPRILMYHSVGGSGTLSVSRKEFDWQMAYIKKRFRVVALSVIPRIVQEGSEGRPVVCITFDDGFADIYDYALPVLSTYGFSATFFIIAGSIGVRHPVFYGSEQCVSYGQVRDIAARGYEIGAHTMSHPKLASLSPAAAYKEIADSKNILENVTGVPIRLFAYPKGSYSDVTIALVKKAGFSVAVTVREGACEMGCDLLALPRIAIDGSTGRMQFKGKLSFALYAYEGIKKWYVNKKRSYCF